ncbi:MAG: serine/threonine-protein kinase [Acidobacteriota bacterium]
MHDSNRPKRASDGIAGEPVAVTPECPGRYLIEAGARETAEIGRGGIGRVLVARDTHLGRDVAVKELLQGAGPDAVANVISGSTWTEDSADAVRFLREARVTGQLEHPNIVPVYELGMRADGTLYYTMKLVRGRTMAHALRECATLDQRLRLLSHFADLCHAIAYAHSRGVIHRDIKAENVMLGEFGETVVLDWGLAKVRGQRDIRGHEIARDGRLWQDAMAGLTVNGSILGTPHHMSPEQARGELEMIDERSDVWALGTVLYEMLTGRRVFEGETHAQVIQKVLNDRVTPPRRIEPGVPPELESVCMWALHRDPSLRYADARELAAEIEAFQSGARVAAHEYTSWDHFRRFAAKHRPMIVAAAATLLAMIIALVFMTASYTRERAALAKERREHLLANYHIAQGVNERAGQLMETHGYLGARVFAAASLLHNPACLQSPFFDPDFRASVPDACRLEIDAASRMYQAGESAMVALDRVLAANEALLGLDISPDQKRVAGAGADGAAFVWNAATGQPVLTLRGHSGAVRAVAFWPAGDQIATAGRDGTAVIWDALTGSLLSRHACGLGELYDIEYSPDGQVLIVAGHDKGVLLWDWRAEKPLGLLSGHEAPVHRLAVAGNGSLLATASRDRTVRLWQLPSGRLMGVLEGHRGVVRGVAVSNDGTKVASASYDKTIKVWNAATGECLFTGEGFHDEVLAVAFSPDGRRVAAACWDRTVTLWDVASGALLIRVDAHDAPAWDVAFARDGRYLASVGEDRRLRIWKESAAPVVLAAQGQGYLWSLRFSPDGSEIGTCGGDGSIRVYSARNGSLISTMPGHHDLVYDIAYSADGSLLGSAGYDRTVRIWNMRTRNTLRVLAGHEGFVRCVAFAPDGGRVVSSSQDGNAIVWDVRSGDRVMQLRADDGPVRRVAFSPDGKLIATAHEQKCIRLWDAQTGGLVARWPAGNTMVTSVAFSHDGTRLVSTNWDGAAVVWDVKRRRPSRTFVWHAEGLFRAMFSPDDRLLATAGDDRTVGLWRVDRDAPSLLLRASQSVMALDFSPDGKRLAWGDGATGRIYPIDLSLLEADPSRIMEKAERAAGARMDGFELRLLGEVRR